MYAHMLRQMLSEVIQMPRCTAFNRNMPSWLQTKQKTVNYRRGSFLNGVSPSPATWFTLSGEDRAPVLRLWYMPKSGKETNLKTSEGLMLL